MGYERKPDRFPSLLFLFALGRLDARSLGNHAERCHIKCVMKALWMDPKRSYGAGRPVCVVEVEARACPLRQLLRGCFSIYRTSSMPAFGLGCCDCCHRLLFE